MAACPQHFPHLGLDESGAHLCSGCEAIGSWARGYWSCGAAASMVVVTEEESSQTPLELGRQSAGG